MATITQLEYLIAVDQYRHFKKAAQSCHVSQPTLSAQLQKLEDELDMIVFDRSKKPIVPTLQGQVIIEHARSVIRQYQKMIEVAKFRKDQVSGQFKLAVIPTLAPYLIPLFIESFAKKYPLVSLVIEEMKTENIIQSLHKDRIDGALLVTPLGDSQLIEKSLFYEPFMPYISQSSSLSSKKCIDQVDLKPENAWLLSEGHCLRDQMLKICQSQSSQKHLIPNVKFTSGNLETLKKLVRNQGGYTLLPYLATLDLSQEDKCHYLRAFNNTVPTREVSLVYSRTFLKENIINALESSILSSLPDSVSSNKTQKISVVPLA